jgi:hypothetical protein
MKNSKILRNVTLLFFLGIITVSALAIQPIKGYKLGGTIKGASDGEKIYVSTYGMPGPKNVVMPKLAHMDTATIKKDILTNSGIMPKFINLDSATIVNGSFSFKENNLREPCMYIVTYRHDGKYLVQYPIILEDGNIVLDLDAEKAINNKVTGSKNTELLLEYARGLSKALYSKVSKERMYKMTTSLANSMNSTTKEIQKKMLNNKDYNEYKMAHNKYTADFICNNMPSLFSASMLFANYRSFDQATKDSVDAVIKTKWPDYKYDKEQINQNQLELMKQVMQSQKFKADFKTW